MKPVAFAIDYIQAEKSTYLGHLIPTIVHVKEHLYRLKTGTTGQDLTYGKNAAAVLYDSVDHRFSYIFEDHACLIATAVHPVFRLGWLKCLDEMPELFNFSKQQKKEQVTQLLTSEIADSIRAQPQVAVEDMDTEEYSSEQDPEEQGRWNVLKLSAYRAEVDENNTTTPEATARTIARTWLEQNASKNFGDEAFNNQASLVNIFLKYNTPLPSSGAVERMFSIAKDIVRSKRNRLSDTTFNTLMFLKGNHDFRS